eukprot:TRINITY_DN1133_c0_g1_i1.p2 TRINITY_DN1133_c0_g1~~TRINITY_DN1133_c0_g1_i1.p2  ORF type:complete len:131 (+),score=39.21 TRINITY_DN1133_c0_g1_i1:1056-1448(+)
MLCRASLVARLARQSSGLRFNSKDNKSKSVPDFKEEDLEWMEASKEHSVEEAYARKQQRDILEKMFKQTQGLQASTYALKDSKDKEEDMAELKTKLDQLQAHFAELQQAQKRTEEEISRTKAQAEAKRNH